MPTPKQIQGAQDLLQQAMQSTSPAAFERALAYATRLDPSIDQQAIRAQWEAKQQSNVERELA